MNHFLNGCVEVDAVEHLVALTVNDFTLFVHNVVEFQDVAAGCKVVRFDFLLRAFNHVGKHFRFNRHVSDRLERVENGIEAVAGEQTKQIVFRGKIEPAVTGVALTTGTAAQLVVDSSGFVALGADDIKTACRAHFFGFVRKCGFVLVFQLAECLARFKDFLVVGFRKAGRFGNHLFGVAFFSHFGFRHEFRVAAENNIGTAARHVRGDGHRAVLTGLRNDFGFFFVIFRVEHFVLNPAFTERF